MSNENDDIAIGPEDPSHYQDPTATAGAVPGTGGTQFHANNAAHEEAAKADAAAQASAKAAKDSGALPDAFSHVAGDDVEVKPFNDEPVRASRNPELAPTSQNPNEPVGEHPAINLTSLLVDMYSVSGQKAYDMCRFGTITIGDEEWTDKTSFAIPYEQIQGKEVTILEEGRGGFKFRYDG